MSDITINLCSSDDTTQRRTPAGNQKRKNIWHRRKMQYLERKHNYNHRMGQYRHDQGPPLPNGAAAQRPSLPASTHNKNIPHPSSTAGASHCSSKPSTSTHSMPSFTATVDRIGHQEKPKGPVNTESTAATPSVSSNINPLPHRHQQESPQSTSLSTVRWWERDQRGASASLHAAV